MNRKSFLLNTIAGSASLITPGYLMSQSAPVEPYDREIVKNFVAAGHNNLAKVKEMLAEYPNLLYARHDGGNGDFEEAIEGAGHVGDRDIANYLISQGARPNIYVLTMLGETEIVKAILDKYPALLNGKGPHGLTLLHHAKRGGDPSKELYEYFQEKGLKEMQIKIK